MAQAQFKISQKITTVPYITFVAYPKIARYNNILAIKCYVLQELCQWQTLKNFLTFTLHLMIPLKYLIALLLAAVCSCSNVRLKPHNADVVSPTFEGKTKLLDLTANIFLSIDIYS